MKTSTPRYRAIDIENTINRHANNNRLLVSSTTSTKSAASGSSASGKTFSDKSITTCDDKSSQTSDELTGFKTSSSSAGTGVVTSSGVGVGSSGSSSGQQNNKQYHRSLDSGITSGLDHTNTTGELGSYSSSTTPFSYSLNKSSHHHSPAGGVGKSAVQSASTASTQRSDKPTASKSLPQVNLV